MLCVVCKKFFIYKRNISNLLVKQRYFICDKCYKETLFDMSITRIPLNNGYYVNIFGILNESYNGYIHAYINEYSYVVSYYLKYKPLLYAVIYLNNSFLDDISVIANINQSDVFVVAYKLII